jgi:hypothetical protein
VSQLSQLFSRRKSKSRGAGRCGAILEHDFGHDRSKRERACVDAAGEPIPWYTYPAIEQIKQFDFSACRVFEFGSGNSTLFWGARAKQVVSVENDPAWYELVRGRIGQLPIDLRLCTEPSGYVATLANAGAPFDVVVVDGRWRYDSAFAAIAALRPGGLIVLDNADWYPNAAALLRSADLIEIDFAGFGPINDYCWTTSLFLHRQCRLAPRGNIRPTPSIGSLPDTSEDDRPVVGK